MKFPKTKKKSSGSIPFGYELTEDGKQLQAVPKQIKMLRDAVDGVITGRIASLREAREIINNASEDAKVSHQTISKYVKQEKIDRGLLDPNAPKRQYNYHSEVKAKISAQRSLREKKKREKKLQAQLSNLKTSLKKQENLQTKLDEPADATTKEGKIVDADDLDLLPDNVREEIKAKEVIFEPNEGPQTDFLAAP